MRFGLKISQLRGDRSPEWVASRVNCSGGTIRRYENGEQQASAANAFDLARLFGVSVDWLLDDAADWPPPPTEKQAATAVVERMLAGAGLAGELNEEERELVSGFRSLNVAGRSRVLGTIDGLNASNASPPDLNPDLAEEPPSGRK